MVRELKEEGLVHYVDSNVDLSIFAGQVRNDHDLMRISMEKGK